MTKEEQLKQEAEEYADKKVPKTLLPNMWERYFNSYLAGAEPREKRIEELEQQIEKMKCFMNCNYSKNSSCLLNSEKKEECKGCQYWRLRK